LEIFDLINVRAVRSSTVSVPSLLSFSIKYISVKLVNFSGAMQENKRNPLFRTTCRHTAYIQHCFCDTNWM